MTKRDKVTVEDIIGIVHTDETTDSVEEVCKLRGRTNERFTIKSQDDLFGVVDNYSADKVCVVNGIRTGIEAKWLCNVLNDLNDENKQLKQSVNNLKDTIIKITIAYQRKYDRTIVDLVDEVHDEDITDLIKELQE